MEFDDYRDADDACYEMNGRDLLGDRYLYLLDFCSLTNNNTPQYPNKF